MKNLCLIMVTLILLVGCTKDITTTAQITPANLAIASTVGIKLQTVFVTNEVSMNVKSNSPQTITIKILNITNSVVSKSTAEVKSGDNILKLYTSSFPSSAYRIGVYDVNGILLAITDFNKI